MCQLACQRGYNALKCHLKELSCLYFAAFSRDAFFVQRKFNKNPGVGDILVEIQLIARADNINTSYGTVVRDFESEAKTR